jgi:hypothetical protein
MDKKYFINQCVAKSKHISLPGESIFDGSHGEKYKKVNLLQQLHKSIQQQAEQQHQLGWRHQRHEATVGGHWWN